MDREPPRRTWWRDTRFRLPFGIVVCAVLLWVPNVEQHWVFHLGNMFFDFDPLHTMAYIAVLLLPFARRVSHRKRDLLVVALVPFLGQVWAAKMVQRALCLPWHDWPPRPDQLPFVARIPGGDGAYVLCPTAGEAAALRTAWCTDPEHDHVSST